MLYNSLLTIVSNGIYLNSTLISYKKLTITQIIKRFYGLNVYYIVSFLQKIEFQYCRNSRNFLNNRYLDLVIYLKLLNIEVLKRLPPFSSVKDLQNLNILKKYLNLSYQGYCHILGKPVRGQRTWSNANTSKNTNSFLRKYCQKRRGSNTPTTKDNWS